MSETGSMAGDARVRDEARRPMVERAVKSPENPLLMQLINRVSDTRNRVMDVHTMLRNEADTIVGSRPDQDRATAASLSPVSGAMGELFTQVSELEHQVEVLEEQARRFRGLA